MHHNTPQHGTTIHSTTPHNTQLNYKALHYTPQNHTMNPIIDTKAILPISAESLKLRAYLRTIPEGTIVTDAQCREASGCNQKRLAGRVASAIRTLEREQVVFYRIRRVGWKRVPLNTTEVSDGESATIKGVRRRMNRSLRRLAAVKFDALSNEEKLKHSSVSAQAGAIALFTSTKASDKIYSATIGNGKQPDTTRLLELFKSNGE